MKRRLLNLPTVLSLLLCLGGVAMWVRSYFAWDSWSYFDAVGATSNNGYCLEVAPRQFTLTLLRFTFAPAERSEFLNFGSLVGPQAHWFNVHVAYAQDPNFAAGLSRNASWLGFGATHSVSRGPGQGTIGVCSTWAVTVPYWFAVMLFAAAPATRALPWIRRSHHSLAGLCPRCGYDLRPTPGRCPECGREAEPASGTT
jgi:hypothetical protein